MENFTLQLRKYVVNNINFTLNENFNAKEQHEIKILPSFQRTVTKLSANDVAVRLSVKVDNSDKSLPFSLEAAVTGFFYMENWFDNIRRRQLLEQSSVTILYPYLRALVNTVTVNANIPPYSLPLINIADLFVKAASGQTPAAPGSTIIKS